MIIGLPKAFLYYNNHVLWKTFFKEIGFKTITSEDTTQRIINQGIKFSIDENCLPLKIYMGHIAYLKDRCDYILVPRFDDLGQTDKYCERFLGIYDLIKNTFNYDNILEYNVQLSKNITEKQGFINIGKILGKTTFTSYKSYKIAKQTQNKFNEAKILEQSKLFNTKKTKILIVAEPYLLNDVFIIKSIIDIIKGQNAVPIFSDNFDSQQCIKLSKTIAPNLYWHFNKQMVGSVVLNKHKVDGVILLTAFPCGNDCMVNELIMRKIKDIPIIQLMFDEHQSKSGLETRIESFIDIINERKNKIEKRFNYKLSTYG